MKLIALAAVSLDGVIATNGEIPWRIKEDMKHYKSLTTENIQLMGYKTYLTMPEVAFRNRQTMVVTHNKFPYDKGRNVYYFNDTILKIVDDIRRSAAPCIVYVTGGQTIYDQMIDHCDEAIITWVNKTFDSSIMFNDEINAKFFPINKLFSDFTEVETTDWLTSESEGATRYKIVKYERSTQITKETHEEDYCKGCTDCTC